MRVPNQQLFLVAAVEAKSQLQTDDCKQQATHTKVVSLMSVHADAAYNRCEHTRNYAAAGKLHILAN